MLIPKIQHAEKIESFRPIDLTIFLFKIICKILVQRLNVIVPDLISPLESAFIKGRQVTDSIVITSECINMLDMKTYGGNIAIKFDIKKAFNTLNWEFLLGVLKKFGFHGNCLSWISSMLYSTNLSIPVNSVPQSFFPCYRGVRRDDPLSPILYCLGEEVLSRDISKIVEEGKVGTIQKHHHMLFMQMM